VAATLPRGTAGAATSLGRLRERLASFDIPITQTRPRVAWIFWLAVLGVGTVAMYSVQARIDQAHVVLLYLLIVLGASASGGRALGLTVAVVAFILIDYLFQPPYNEFAIGKPLDWLVLLAFLTDRKSVV